MSMLMTMMVLAGPVVNAVVATPPQVVSEVHHLPYRHTPIEPLEEDPLQVALAAVQDEPTTTPFGTKGSQRLNYGGGFALNIKNDDDWHVIGGVEWSNYLEDNLSLDLGLNALYVDQPGQDAVGGNFTLLLRWHFLTEDTWSLYLDGGAGLLYSTERVPLVGTKFNFTPQGGIGATFDIGDDKRLMVGVRWHHISNANIADWNPGRDAIEAYMGVSVPF